MALSKKSMTYVWLVLALAFVGSLVFGLAERQSGADKDLKAQYLEGGDFRLQGKSGELSLANFKGQPLVLYFGFTHCPDICPIGLTVIRDALKSDPAFAEVNALFVTVDPERDTSEHLAEYLSFFHPNIQGGRTDLAQTVALGKRYGTYFKKGKLNEHGAYAVDHTAYFYVLDAQGELMRVLDHDAKPEDLAQAIKTYL